MIFYNVFLSQNTRYNKKDSAKIVDAQYIQYDLENTEKSNLANNARRPLLILQLKIKALLLCCTIQTAK